MRASSIVFPELKTDVGSSKSIASVDWDVLQQAIDRVVNRMRVSAFFRLSLSFAITMAYCR